MATLEYLVVGFSLAGIAAAEKLAKTSSVGIIEYIADTGSVDELLRSPLTAWAPEEMDGVEFQGAATEHLEKIGVQRFSLTHATAIESDGSGITVIDRSWNRRIRCRGMVFAPNGSEVGLPDSLKAESLFGYGITYSGLADIVFAKNEVVAVFGCGARSLQEVERASRFCPRVHWICNGRLSASLTNIAHAEDRVEILEEAQIVALAADASGLLTAVVVRRDQQDKEIPVRALVVAQDLVTSWNLFGGRGVAMDLVRRGKVALAGLAAGVNYDDTSALWASGIAAAMELLGRYERDEKSAG